MEATGVEPAPGEWETRLCYRLHHAPTIERPALCGAYLLAEYIGLFLLRIFHYPKIFLRLIVQRVQILF